MLKRGNILKLNKMIDKSPAGATVWDKELTVGSLVELLKPLPPETPVVLAEHRELGAMWMTLCLVNDEGYTYDPDEDWDDIEDELDDLKLMLTINPD